MNQSLVIHNPKIQKIILILGLIILSGLGFILRINGLGNQSLWIDEGYSINAASTILEKGYPLLDSGELYLGGILNNYLITLSIKISGFDAFNPWPARLPSIFFGTGIILLAYFLVKKMFNNKTLAFCASFIMAFSSWEIAWSRQARGYIAAQFFILLTIYFFWQWLETKKIKHLAFLLLSFVAAYFSHAIAIVFAPSLIIAFIAYQILHPQNRLPKRHFISALVALILVPTALIILIIISGEINIYNFSTSYLNYLFGDLKIFAWLALFGFIWGIFSDKDFWPVVFVSMAVIFPLLVIMFYSQTIQARYLFSIFPFLAILAIYFIGSLFQKIIEVFKLPIQTLIPALALSALVFLGHLNFSLKDYYALEWDSPQPNFKEAYALIKQSKKEGELVISPYTPLSKIYLKDKGLWLAISLTGKSEELTRNIINGKDYYAGAPVIEDAGQLMDIIENQTGFIVIDRMAAIRLEKQNGDQVRHPKIEEIYESGVGLNQIWVYKF